MPAGLVPFRIAFRSHGCPILTDAVCRGVWVTHPLEAPPSKSEDGAPAQGGERESNRRKKGGSNVPHPFAGLYNSGKHSLPICVLAVMQAGLVPFRIAFRSHGCPTLPDAVCRGGWVVHPLEAPLSKGEDGAPAPARVGLCCSAGIPAGRMPALQQVGRGWGASPFRTGLAAPRQARDTVCERILSLSKAAAAALLLCALLPQSGAAAPGFVQGTDTSGASASPSIGFASTVLNHSLLVACAGWTTTTVTLNTVTSSPSNTWNSTTDVNNSGKVRIQCYYAMNAASGTTTVTFNFSASVSWEIAIHEYSGVATTSALDQQNGGTGNSSSPSSGSVTTGANGELIFGWTANSFGVNSYTAGTGFTQRQSDLAFYASEDQVQGTAGAISATWAQGGSSAQWAAKVLAFKAAGGAAKPHQLPTLGVGGMSHLVRPAPFQRGGDEGARCADSVPSISSLTDFEGTLRQAQDAFTNSVPSLPLGIPAGLSRRRWNGTDPFGTGPAAVGPAG